MPSVQYIYHTYIDDCGDICCLVVIGSGRALAAQARA